MSTPANGISGLFAQIGNLVSGNTATEVENAATQAFTAIAGELVIIIILLAVMVGRHWND